MLWCISWWMRLRKYRRRTGAARTGLATGYIQVLHKRCFGAHRDCLPRGHIFGYGSGSQPECQMSKETWNNYDMNPTAEAATTESPNSQKEYIYIHMKLLQLKLKPIKNIYT